MTFTFDEAVEALCKIANREPIDWEAFDNVLSQIEDINQWDDRADETILSDFFKSVDALHNGQKLVHATRCFLAHGYDVKANEGRNGGLALSSLSWSSYDRYVLDVAKLLMDAGAPLDYPPYEDDDDDECGVFGSIGWRISGAWGPDKDYDTANIFEAYYAIANAYKDGKDYRSISSFLDCVGAQLTHISAVKSEDDRCIEQEGIVYVFPEALILWFDNRPLVISHYLDMVVNPLYAHEHDLVNIDDKMSSLIGATLTDIVYWDSITGYLTFDNGQRLIFSNRNTQDNNRHGMCAVGRAEEYVAMDEIDIEYVCFPNGWGYADYVTGYEHEAVAVFDKEHGYLVRSVAKENNRPFLQTIMFDKALLGRYGQRVVMAKPQEIVCYRDDGKTIAVKMACGSEFFYLCATQYDIEIRLSDEEYVPYGEYDLRGKPGKHLLFEERERT